MQSPSVDHAQFNAICDRIGEFEPLPAVVTAPVVDDDDDDVRDGEQVEELDGLILAGLVLPY
jgi:hypothetical protein